jgi:nitrite reductase/ring-hydroxylating ferredoxin subunit
MMRQAMRTICKGGAMVRWVRLCDRDDLPSVGRGWPYESEVGDVALFNLEGELYAIESECPHQSASLGMGQLAGNIVTCPGHGLRYDVTTGRTLGSTPGVRSYPVEFRADGIYIDIEPATD